MMILYLILYPLRILMLQDVYSAHEETPTR